VKGLSGEGQRTLLELKEQHRLSETQIVEAVLTKSGEAEVLAAIQRYQAEMPERPYRRANISAPRPRHSKYGFGGMIGSRAGAKFDTEQFAKSVDWILANAYGFARRWRVVMKYERVGDTAIHVWFFRADDPLAQARTGKELRRMIQREEQQQAVA
jgi:hypothetical protein